MDNIKNIVFDMGGVLLTLDHERAVNRFLEIGVDNARDLLDPYHQKGIFLDLEEGKLSREEFYEAIRKNAGKNIPDKDIDYGWMGFITENPEYKLEMLEQLKEKYNLYLLSNTNPIIMSWTRSSDFSAKGKGIEEYFHKLYLSYEIGVTKPDRAIFDYMISDSGLIPAETLFIDDGTANIEMGKLLGMNTYQPKNGEDFRGIF